MRFVSFALLAGIFSLASPPASAAWQEYIYEDLGIAKSFPAKPVRTEGLYETPEFATDNLRVAGLDRPAVHFTTELDNIHYRMSVVDISDIIDDAINVFGECILLAEQSGGVISNIHLGVGLTGGRPTVFGRLVTVDLPGGRGRMRTACLVNNGKLYRTEAIVRPEHGNLDAPEVERFMTTQRFDLETDFEAEEAQALADYQYFLEHGVFPDEVPE
nr:MAG: hypothetical protein E4H34_00550 [Hyphomicrobiales bacterium]